MGERKVLNKYYSPDFDPAKIGRRRHPKIKQGKLRMMLPMVCRCKTCGEYLYPGTKFNSRKEEVRGDKYLGSIQVFRFYSRCTKCSAEISYKTDPQNSGYLVESGATHSEAVKEDKKRKRDMGGEEDVLLKDLEKRTIASKREMDVVVALDEHKSLKSRHESVTVNAMLQALPQRSLAKELELEDELVIKSIYFHGSHRRIKDDEDEELDDVGKLNKGSQEDYFTKNTLTLSQSSLKLRVSYVVPRKPNKDVGICSALQSLCNNYEDDDDH